MVKRKKTFSNYRLIPQENDNVDELVKEVFRRDFVRLYGQLNNLTNYFCSVNSTSSTKVIS